MLNQKRLRNVSLLQQKRNDLIHNVGDVTVVIVQLAVGTSYLADHPIPNASDQLAVLAVGDQVEIVGKLYGAGQLLQDVYAEAFTAQFSVWLSVTHDTKERGTKRV